MTPCHVLGTCEGQQGPSVVMETFHRRVLAAWLAIRLTCLKIHTGRMHFCFFWRPILWISQWLKGSNVGVWFTFEYSYWLTASNQGFSLVNLKQAGRILFLLFSNRHRMHWSHFKALDCLNKSNQLFGWCRLFGFCCLKMHIAWLNPLPRPSGQLSAKMLVRRIFQCIFDLPF